MKRCNRCGELKEEAAFRRNGPRLRSYCRLCQNARFREMRAANREKWKARERAKQAARVAKDPRRFKEYNRHIHLNRFYRLSLEQYNEMLKSQNGVCAICKSNDGKPLHVDHCH